MKGYMIFPRFIPVILKKIQMSEDFTKIKSYPSSVLPQNTPLMTLQKYYIQRAYRCINIYCVQLLKAEWFLKDKPDYAPHSRPRNLWHH